MSVKRRVFPESFKREAVDRVVSSGLSAGKVAAELGRRRRGRRGAPVRRRWPRRRLIWPPRTPGSSARTISFGWSATS
jgi:transposase-like protein